MAWIKVDQTVKDHRKVLSVTDSLDIEPVTVLGMLVSLWIWALDNAEDGSLEDVSPRSIARAAQWCGDPADLVEALKTAGFIDITEDGSMMLHDWYEWAGNLIEKRKAEKERSRRRRQKANGQNVDDQQTTDGQPTDKPTDDQQTTDGQPTDKPTDDRAETVGRVEKSKSRVELSLSSEANASEESETPAADPVPYEAIKTIYHDHCPSFPRIRKLSANRKKAIAARWKEYKANMATFIELFDMAEASLFLQGQNSRNWSADFDWLMNSDNMAKVLEGKYNDQRRQQPRNETRSSTFDVLAGIAAEEGGLGA